MGTTGVVGQGWRANVTTAGFVEPYDGTAPLGWYVAADDRWHDPRTDTGVRHRRIAGTAVFETNVRVPGGNATQRVWSVADAGGFTLVSVDNDSPAPIAVAFTRGDLASNRPAPHVPIEGITLPAGSVVFPVGHRATITVGLGHGRDPTSSLPRGLPTADSTHRGWVSRTDVASRLDLPEEALVEAVRAARCEVLLGTIADVDTEPERHLLAVAELIRLGDLGHAGAVDAAPTVAAAVAATLRRRHGLGVAALDAAAVALAAAGERRALSDLARLRPQGGAAAPDEDVVVARDDIAAVPAVERRLLRGPVLFPAGIPPAWRGQNFEAHRLVAGPVSQVSLAVRWHGPNPAVLWDIAGEPVALAADVGGSPWTTSAARGEALWTAEAGVHRA